MIISFIAVFTVKEKKIQDVFPKKADNKMLEHIVLTEIKAYLRQNISQEQIKIQKCQNYEKYHDG